MRHRDVVMRYARIYNIPYFKKLYRCWDICKWSWITLLSCTAICCIINWFDPYAGCTFYDFFLFSDALYGVIETYVVILTAGPLILFVLIYLIASVFGIKL